MKKSVITKVSIHYGLTRSVNFQSVRVDVGYEAEVGDSDPELVRIALLELAKHKCNEALE